MIIGKESETVEFKLTTAEKKEAAESIVAILNKHCKGTIYFGVDDSGFIKGQQISDSTKKDISRIISETVQPKISPTIDTLVIDGKEIIRVSFSGYNRPYSISGKYLTRVGTENRIMPVDDLKRLIKNDDYSSKWEDEITNYKLKDLDEAALLDFYNSAKNCGRLEIDKFDKEKILTSLDLVKNGFLKNGGYALFGKNARISLKLATYATDNKIVFTDLKLYTGNIYTLIGEALKYVLNNIKWKVAIGSRKREEIPEIPERALREIIVNAFAHTDYETTPEIEIGIHPGKIEIYNPGTFPQELTPFDFIERNLPSYKRNKLILDVLFRSKDVEKSGTGFQRVNKLCNENNVSWTFRKESHGFFFEFLRSNILLDIKLKEKLSENEQLVYNLILNNEKISKEEISIRLEKSEKTIQRIIKSLSDKNLIMRMGSNKKGYWEIV